MKKWNFTLITFSLALLLATPPVFAGGKRDERPNILFCIGDDWGWPSCGALGDNVVRTPTFDRVAREGVLFPHTYCAAPSCSPSRASILTGQMFYRLEEGAIIWSKLPNKFPVYTDMLEAAGYHVGLMRKGWGPGSYEAGGWKRNPAGASYKSFTEFLQSVPKGKPFCFWFGTTDPHRPYELGSGARDHRIEDVRVPPMLPDVPAVRNDILDYYVEVERADREIGEMLKLLEVAGQLDNTLVLITGDNGWPFPRGKANLYDYGTRQPLAVRWPARVKGGRVVDDFISFCDFAPTFLEAAGLKPTSDMTGRSFLGVLASGKAGRVDPKRDRVVVGLERHGQPYPMRSIRTHQFRYIRNFKPEEPYRVCDDGPSKAYLFEHADDPKVKPLFELCFGKRPAEELYDHSKDPHELRNVAGDPAYAAVKKRLAADLENYLRETKDPRVIGGAEMLDHAPSFRDALKSKKKK
ncbi:MAG: sulfatase [Verrucomicrobia bacterium]|nr:sulfatase [Verrucomicrobiota bacterium]